MKKQTISIVLAVVCPKCRQTVNETVCRKCGSEFAIVREAQAPSFDVNQPDEAEAEVETILRKWLNSWDNALEGTDELLGMLQKILSERKLVILEGQEVV